MTDHMPFADELAVVFARVSGLLLTRETVNGALELVTALATETIPGSAGAGVTLLDDRGERTTAAASDPVVAQADAVQYDIGEGPCLEAWAQRLPVRVDDISSDERWPRWAKAVAPLGLRSSLSVPLVAGDSALGAIKVYGAQPGAYDRRAERLLSLLAGQAAVLIANMQSRESASRLSDQLRQALASRDRVAQAKGILMRQECVDESTAFAMIVGVARRDQRKVDDVAREIVDGVSRRRR